MAEIPAWVLQDTVQVEARTGESPTGPLFAAPVPLRCLVEATRRHTITDTGAVLTIDVTLYSRVADAPPVGSRVTLPDGTTTTVNAVANVSAGRLALPDHAEITCG